MDDANEIIERLENLAKHAVHCVGEPRFVMSLDDGIALHKAIDLLKLQEPKPPVVKENSYGWKFYYCPSCGREFYQNNKFSFCEKCGQAVLWVEQCEQETKSEE